jgi:hypothetical protein
LEHKHQSPVTYLPLVWSTRRTKPLVVEQVPPHTQTEQ